MINKNDCDENKNDSDENKNVSVENKNLNENQTSYQLQSVIN